MRTRKTYLSKGIKYLRKMYRPVHELFRIDLGQFIREVIDMRILVLMKFFKERALLVMVMTFILLSFWLYMTPITSYAASTGATRGKTTISIGPGTSWNISDSASASIGSSSSSAYLRAGNYDFSSIPIGAIIDGIKVTVSRYASYSNAIQDSSVFLVNKQGNFIGDNNSSTSYWPGSQPPQTKTYTWTATELIKDNLSYDDIANSNFGVALSIKNTSDSSCTAYVNYIQITVSYTADTTVPSIFSVTGNASSLQNSNVSLTVNAVDTLSGIAKTGGYSFDNGITWQDSNQKIFEENQVVNIKVKDAAGNISSPTQIVIDKIDKLAPTLTLQQSSTPEVYGSITITPNSTDSNGVDMNTYEYAFGTRDTAYFRNGGTPFTTSFIVSESGDYTVYVKDNAGNETISTIPILISAPTISTSSNVIMLDMNDTYGRMYFLSTATKPEGYNIIECGVVVSTTVNSTLDKANASRILAAPVQNSKGQFYSFFNVTYNHTIYLRPYIVYKNLSTGKETPTYYGDIIVATMIKK